MKKFILSFFFVLVSVLFVIVVPASAEIDPNERWSGGGNEYSVQYEGNNITLTPVNPKRPRAAGIPALVGTITGTSFTGKQYVFADGCPSLEGYVPATGTVSADGSSISVTNKMTNYSPSSCEINYTYEDSITYTKTSPQNSPARKSLTPLPSPTPSEIPLNLNGTWTTVNEFGTSFTFSAHHSGNSLTLQITDASDAKIKDSIGKTSLSGTLSGHTFSGTQILIAYAPKCLGKYFNTDGAGTVATDGSSITVSYTNFYYNGNTCARNPGTEFPGSITYVRANAGQNPTRAKNTKQVNPSPNITITAEKPQVGVSSKDFKALVQANNEYQKAQADLDKLKANQDFANKYNTLLDKAKALPPEGKDYLQAVREKLEYIRDTGSSYQDVKDTLGYLKTNKFEYGGMSFATDVGNGTIKYMDLRAKGVAADDAFTKATIDTAAPSLFMLYPPLKVAEMVATLPDKSMVALGFGEKHWARTQTNWLAKNAAPSAFVEKTTDAMIQTQNWSNMGGALQVAWEDVKTAEGFGGKAQATLDLVGTAVGAIPVAIAMQARDKISAVFSGAKNIGNLVSNISSWFTYPE